MNSETIQHVKEVGPPAAAAAVTGASGWATYFDYLPAVFGSFASVAAGVLSIMLTIKTYHDIKYKAVLLDFFGLLLWFQDELGDVTSLIDNLGGNSDEYIKRADSILMPENIFWRHLCPLALPCTYYPSSSGWAA